MSRNENLIPRTTRDPNFISVLGLLASSIGVAQALTPGTIVPRGADTCLALLAEMTLAFVRHHAAEDSDLGKACREVLDLHDAFEKARIERNAA